MKIKEALKYTQPTKFLVTNENYSDVYKTPVLTAGKTFILGYTNEDFGIFEASKTPILLFDDFTGDVRYIDFDFKIKSSAAKILSTTNSKYNLKYFYYLLKKINYKSFSHKRIWISEVSNFDVDEIDYNKQLSIVNILDNIINAIDIKKHELEELDELIKSRFNEMFGDPILNNKNWDTFSLKDKVKINSLKKPLTLDNNVWILNLDKIESNTGRVLSYDYINKDEIPSSTIYFNDMCVLYSKLRPYLNKVVIPNKNGFATSELVSLETNNSINKFYLGYLLRQNSFVEFINATSCGAKMPRASMDSLRNFSLIFPPIELQNEFADFVKLIDKSKLIIEKQIKELQELFDSKMDQYFG